MEIHPLTLQHEGADAILSCWLALCGVELVCAGGENSLGPSSLLQMLVLLSWWSVKGVEDGHHRRITSRLARCVQSHPENVAYVMWWSELFQNAFLPCPLLPSRNGIALNSATCRKALLLSTASLFVFPSPLLALVLTCPLESKARNCFDSSKRGSSSF